MICILAPVLGPNSQTGSTPNAQEIPVAEGVIEHQVISPEEQSESRIRFILPNKRFLPLSSDIDEKDLLNSLSINNEGIFLLSRKYTPEGVSMITYSSLKLAVSEEEKAQLFPRIEAGYHVNVPVWNILLKSLKEEIEDKMGDVEGLSPGSDLILNGTLSHDFRSADPEAQYKLGLSGEYYEAATLLSHGEHLRYMHSSSRYLDNLVPNGTTDLVAIRTKISLHPGRNRIAMIRVISLGIEDLINQIVQIALTAGTETIGAVKWNLKAPFGCCYGDPKDLRSYIIYDCLLRELYKHFDVNDVPSIVRRWDSFHVTREDNQYDVPANPFSLEDTAADHLVPDHIVLDVDPSSPAATLPTE